MATVVDLLRKLGKRAAGASAFAGPVVLPGAPAGAAAADAASLAQAGARSSIALLGHGTPVHAYLAATVATRLKAQPDSSGLWIVPQRGESTAALRVAARDAGIDMLDAAAGRSRPAQLVLATPQQLHLHLLRAHDRAWRWLWPRLDMFALPELHTYAGAPAAHLRWLLRRAARLRAQAGAAAAPVLAASLAPVGNADAAIATITDRGKLVQGRVRLMRPDDRPPHATLVALWRCGPDRAAELERLVAELAAHKLQADVLDGISAPGNGRAAGTAAAHVAIAPFVPRTAAERTTLLRSGYRLLVLLAGEEPHELFFADHPELLASDDVVFPDGSENPYVAAPHLCCAAAELPLVDAELDRWSAVELRDRLAKRGALQQLPGENAWYARADPPDPYEELDPRAIGGEPYAVAWPDGRKHGIVPPLLVQRIARAGAVVAPGVRVTTVDDAARSITIAADASAVATVVASSAEVVVRDELAARTLKHIGVDLTRGRVTINQRILALRDLLADGTQRRVSIQPPHEMQWSAAACWLQLPVAAGTRLADVATAGWSIAYALPLLMLAAPDALTAAYDEERRIMYFVETEPGGTGVAAAVYERFEQLVACAQQLATACGRRPAWERLAASEAQLLATLAGEQHARPGSAAQPLPGGARVYSPRSSDEPQIADQPLAASVAASDRAEQTQSRILRFPTREQRDAQAEDRSATVEPPRRRPAVYDSPQVAALAAEQPEPPTEPEPPLREVTGAEILLEQLIQQPALGEASRTFEAPITPPSAGEAEPLLERPAAEQDVAPRRRERRPVEQAAPAEPAAAAAEPPKPDVKALIERMRRLREEREAQQREALARQAEKAARLLPPIDTDDGELRFHIGQRVQCLPYGTGVVRSSRRSDERELVLIEFPEYGEIEVDSSVSLMRAVDDAGAAGD